MPDTQNLKKGDVPIRHIPIPEGDLKITVEGSINAKWNDVHGSPGDPVTDVQDAANGGHVRHYRNGGIWLPDKKAPHAVCGAIYNKYMELGGESGFLGYPLIDSSSTSDGIGLFCNFQGGAIYWHPTTGAFEVHGAIRAKWESLGAEKFGYPTSDEYTTVDGEGRVNSFQAIGQPETRIYWKRGDTHAHPIIGAILQKWNSKGGELGYLGYPKSDPFPIGNSRFQTFQNGSIKFIGGVAYDLPLSKTFSNNFVPDIPLGGSWELTINSDGHWNFKGHLRATGAPSYEVSVASVFRFKDYAGRVIAVTEEGHVHGTDSIGSRNYDWDRLGFSPDIQTNFYDLCTAGVYTELKADSTVGDVLEAIFLGPLLTLGDIVAHILSGNTGAALKACGPVSVSAYDEESGEESDETSRPIYNDQDPCPDTGD